MSKTTTATTTIPASSSSPRRTAGEMVTEPVDAEVLAFREQFEGRSPLDELVRTGAQRMLQAAIEAEGGQFPRHTGGAQLGAGACRVRAIVDEQRRDGFRAAQPP